MQIATLTFDVMKITGDIDSIEFVKELIDSHTAIEDQKIAVDDIDLSIFKRIYDEFNSNNAHGSASEFYKFVIDRSSNREGFDWSIFHLQNTPSSASAADQSPV